MKEKVVIALDQKEQVELEQIIIDGDEKQAMEFLRRVIKEKVDKANAPGCKPVFEWKVKEPQMLTEMKEKAKNKNPERSEPK